MVINWTKLYSRYKGKWVALKSDERTVVASGKSASEALMKAKEKGYEKPILTRMPINLHTVVG